MVRSVPKGAKLMQNIYKNLIPFMFLAAPKDPWYKAGKPNCYTNQLRREEPRTGARVPNKANNYLNMKRKKETLPQKPRG